MCLMEPDQLDASSIEPLAFVVATPHRVFMLKKF
jgi:hypothetical protein